MKQMINELGVANISFLDDIGFRSLHYQQEHSGRGLNDDLEVQLHSSIREDKAREGLLDKVSEFRDLKKTLKKELELQNISAIAHGISYSIEGPEANQ